MNAPRPALDPEAERQIVDAIVALDWSTDPVAQPLNIIQEHLGVENDGAIALFLDFQKRNLMICRPEHMANNVAETGRYMPPIRSQWVRPEETTE